MDPTPLTPLVLIADDYPDLADMMAEMLTALVPAPLFIRVAFDGAQALAMTLEQPPHIAFLDIDMPVLNGVDAAKRIRAALAPAPILVAVTGNPSNIDMLRGTNLFDHVLAKPVDFERLVKLIPGV